jgi:hypothetical protein
VELNWITHKNIPQHVPLLGCGFVSASEWFCCCPGLVGAVSFCHGAGGAGPPQALKPSALWFMPRRVQASPDAASVFWGFWFAGNYGGCDTFNFLQLFFVTWGAPTLFEPYLPQCIVSINFDPKLGSVLYGLHVCCSSFDKGMELLVLQFI